MLCTFLGSLDIGILIDSTVFVVGLPKEPRKVQVFLDYSLVYANQASAILCTYIGSLWIAIFYGENFFCCTAQGSKENTCHLLFWCHLASVSKLSFCQVVYLLGLIGHSDIQYKQNILGLCSPRSQGSTYNLAPALFCTCLGSLGIVLLYNAIY